MVFNAAAGREIPVGWEVRKVRDFLNVITGKEDANFATQNGRFAFFTCGEETLRCDVSRFNGKSVLIAGNGNFNVKYYDKEFNAYQRTYILTPNDEQYVGIIHQSACRTINKFTNGSNGSIIKFITKCDVENINVLVPNSLELLKPFNQVLDIMQKNKDEASYLATLRDFLLPLLMNGQVFVD